MLHVASLRRRLRLGVTEPRESLEYCTGPLVVVLSSSFKARKSPTAPTCRDLLPGPTRLCSISKAVHKRCMHFAKPRPSKAYGHLVRAMYSKAEQSCWRFVHQTMSSKMSLDRHFYLNKHLTAERQRFTVAQTQDPRIQTPTTKDQGDLGTGPFGLTSANTNTAV